MPPFFIPGATSPDEAERLFRRIRAHVDERHGEPLDDRDRIFELVHVDSARHCFRVGEPNPVNGHLVAAIFELWGPRFVVCSLDREQIVVHEVSLATNDVVSMELFDAEHRLSRLLPGTWQLLSRVDRTSTGAVLEDPALGTDPIALLFYDRSGHFAAQFMKRDRSAAPAAGPADARNNTQAQGGYDAYFGEYTVDDATGVVTQRLLGALGSANVGLVLSRAMTVEGDTLTIQLETNAWDGTPVTRTLVWERVG